jgi:ATP-binding cassette subfamily C protein CydCD
VALGWGALRVEAGQLPLSTLLIVLLLGVEVFRPLRDLVQLFHGSMLAVAATRGMYQLLDTVPEVQAPRQSLQPIRLAPVVRFEHVTFGYQGGRRPAVQDCSFELLPGQTLGIVGPSGAGKSTLVNLLLRFVDPQQGRVLLDEHDIRELPLDVLRRHMAVVAQDTYLFYGTVADNLWVAKPGAERAELEAACRRRARMASSAPCHVAGDALIGERGVPLSGGQRQRLAIARALLGCAILVLDEALSRVDAENEPPSASAQRLQRSDHAGDRPSPVERGRGRSHRRPRARAWLKRARGRVDGPADGVCPLMAAQRRRHRGGESAMPRRRPRGAVEDRQMPGQR